MIICFNFSVINIISNVVYKSNLYIGRGNKYRIDTFKIILLIIF